MSNHLPPAAEARMAEIRRSGTWGSALTSDEFAAIRSVGFEAVGQVLGAAVYNVGYTGGYGCPGAWGSYSPGLGQQRADPGLQPGRLRIVRAAGADDVRGAAGRHRPDGGRVRRARRARGRRGPADDRLLPRGRPGVQGDRHRGAGAGRAAAAAPVHLRPVRPGLRQAGDEGLDAGRPGARDLGRRQARRLADQGARPAGARATPRSAATPSWSTTRGTTRGRSCRRT